VDERHNVAAKQYFTITEPPRLLATTSNSSPLFAIRGGRNLQYDIETSTDLATWSRLDTLTITNLDGTASINDTNAPISDRRFYRAASR